MLSVYFHHSSKLLNKRYIHPTNLWIEIYVLLNLSCRRVMQFFFHPLSHLSSFPCKYISGFWKITARLFRRRCNTADNITFKLFNKALTNCVHTLKSGNFSFSLFFHCTQIISFSFSYLSTWKTISKWQWNIHSSNSGLYCTGKGNENGTLQRNEKLFKLKMKNCVCLFVHCFRKFHTYRGQRKVPLYRPQ